MVAEASWKWLNRFFMNVASKNVSQPFLIREWKNALSLLSYPQSRRTFSTWKPYGSALVFKTSTEAFTWQQILRCVIFCWNSCPTVACIHAAGAPLINILWMSKTNLVLLDPWTNLSGPTTIQDLGRIKQNTIQMLFIQVWSKVQMIPLFFLTYLLQNFIC